MCDHDWRKAALTIDDDVYVHQCKKCFESCAGLHGSRALANNAARDCLLTNNLNNFATYKDFKWINQK